ncbi:hypothetical protein [Burkholderia glumae]|uniref:hypothetical protein n=1 Tax=Burkholderia glumae TaxID=337 RepID=UPI0021508EF4|nr:hypothetical protein [Burkholderia glumae]
MTKDEFDAGVEHARRPAFCRADVLVPAAVAAGLPRAAPTTDPVGRPCIFAGSLPG